MKKYFIFFILMITLFSCKQKQALDTVSKVDLEKYAGTWYEISRLPNKFEKGLECVTATYKMLENGKVEVLNKGHKIKDHSKVSKAKGKAWRPNPKYEGRLKVTFFWPFAGDYYIIELDKDYQYAMVGSPNRKYLWVLARTKKLDKTIYETLLKSAKEKGFEVEKMIQIKHNCNIN